MSLQGLSEVRASRRARAPRARQSDSITIERLSESRGTTMVDSVAFLNTNRNGLVCAAVFGVGRAKGTLKILQELLNHGGLVAVVRAGITYLTSKCPAGAGSLFRILFHDGTLNHDASVALNDIVSRVPVSNAYFSYYSARAARAFFYLATASVVKFVKF